MLVAYDDSLTAHLRGVPHPEQPDRVRVVADELRRRGMLGERVDTRVARPDELARIHPAKYIELVRRTCDALEQGDITDLITGDTTVDAGSYEGAARGRRDAGCARGGGRRAARCVRLGASARPPR
jgi:acetoin utilization deacetylase AcuC-like enzyme